MKRLFKKIKIVLPAVLFSMAIFLACGRKKINTQGTPDVNVTTTQAKQSNDKRELKDAPDFTLKKMNGESFTLSEHEGKVVVLNIWATWCPPCRKEIPYFIEIQEEMRDEGVLFVGVSMDKEGWKVVRPFAEDYGINYPIVVDDGTVYGKYGPFRGIPTTFIINKEGKVAYVALGMVGERTLKSVLTKLADQ